MLNHTLRLLLVCYFSVFSFTEVWKDKFSVAPACHWWQCVGLWPPTCPSLPYPVLHLHPGHKGTGYAFSFIPGLMQYSLLEISPLHSLLENTLENCISNSQFTAFEMPSPNPQAYLHFLSSVVMQPLVPASESDRRRFKSSSFRVLVLPCTSFVTLGT